MKSNFASWLLGGLLLLSGAFSRSEAATYNVGPSQSLTNLAAVPWGALHPGDAVNIFYKPGGYHEIIQVSEAGTSNAPITIHGVPDPVTGALPQLDGSNAVMDPRVNFRNSIFEIEGIIVVTPRQSNFVYGVTFPAWITIDSLDIRNALYQTNGITFTDEHGATRIYDTFACGIYVEYAQHLTIRNCEISFNGNGIFANSKNGAAQASSDLVIERNYIHDNGQPILPGIDNGYHEHNIYVESVGVTYQYNRFGPLRPGCHGCMIKDRSSRCVIRYNDVVSTETADIFAILDPQGGAGYIDQMPDYRDAYVYGNNITLQSVPNGMADIVWFAAVNGAAYYPTEHRGTLYFYNNTVANHQNVVSAFSVTDPAYTPTTNIFEVVDCRNNIFYTDSSVQTLYNAFHFIISPANGTLNLGTNWVSPGSLQTWTGHAFGGVVNGWNTQIVGDSLGANNPGFYSLAATNNHLLSSSRSIDAAMPQAAAVLLTTNSPTLEYLAPTNFQTRMVNGLGLDLGAFEGISTNVVGTIYSLTVSNGYGSGNYPVGANVGITASTPGAGQIFWQWTGATVANPLAATTTCTMPGSNAVVIALFTNAPVGTNFILTVNNGTGGGTYSAGTVVPLAANSPGSGQAFSQWTGATVANAFAAATTLTMPASNATVTATYTNLPVVINTNNSSLVAYPQNTNTTVNTPVAITLTGFDPASNTLVFAISQLPGHGTLTGTPPNVVYTPANNYNEADYFFFTVANSNSVSAPALVWVAVNFATNPPPVAVLTSPANNSVFGAPATFSMTATATASHGTMSRVNFYDGTNFLGFTTSSPYAFTFTNAAAGTHTLAVKAIDNYNGHGFSPPVVVTCTNAAGTYALTVINGSGGGSYAAGAVVGITANAPPSGQVFDHWSGFGVANMYASSTTLTMPASNVVITANYITSVTPATYTLTVVNGTGGGSYAAGSVAYIVANNPPAGQVFDKWTGATVGNALLASTTLVMPSANVMVTATYKTPPPIPFPVTSHPRLWITTNDLPRLRSWATATNPVFQALQPVLAEVNNNYNTQYFPGGVQNPAWPDPGDSQGYAGLHTEEDAFVYAFYSLIDPSATQRAIYAQRAASLIRVAMTEAAKGTLANAPFRDHLFATYNRANATLETMPLAVDWIYNALGTNGQPVLSSADKLTIRNGFLTWADQCLYASTAGGDAPPVAVVNNPAQLCPNNSAYRMAANNYYLSHARLLTLMSLAIDPQDDPAVNTNLPVTATTNSLRSYLTIATGGWLFQEYAMFGDGPQVASDYGFAGHGGNFGFSSGGLPSEGMLYGHSLEFLFSGLLALQTAGFNNTNYAGPQSKLIGVPFFDRYCNAWLSALMPAPTIIQNYLPPAYQMMGYGDILRLYITPDFSEMYSLLSLLDRETGITNRQNKTRWLAISAPQGNAAGLLNRISVPWGNAQDYAGSILYFLSLDPALTLTPADPRPTLPTLFYDAPQGTLVAHADWSTNNTMLHWRASWNTINHQDADGGMFQFFRKGEFLTKEYSGYDNTDIGQASWLHNTLALQNISPSGTPQNLNWFEDPLWQTGSQWILGANAGDPQTSASTGTAYVFTAADLTPLYNRPSFYTPTNAALDITQASRSLLWLKPDHLVIYDRATSKTAGLFKRFNLCLPVAPSVAARNGGGSSLTETMPGGQRLFISSLLPASGTVTINPLANVVSTVAEGEPCNYRYTVEDTNNPTNVRFLHVLQGADAGVAADVVANLQSSSGSPFEGAVVRGVAVLFPVNVLTNNFVYVTYAAPLSVTNHYLAGLMANASYAASVQTNAGLLQVIVTPGAGLSADSAGVLAFNNSGAGLNVVPPQWTSVGWTNGVCQLAGSGTALMTYQVQASTNLTTTNWVNIGAATADSGGSLQFLDATNSANRFYRLVH